MGNRGNKPGDVVPAPPRWDRETESGPAYAADSLTAAPSPNNAAVVGDDPAASGMAFVMTRAVKAQLRELGYSDAAIYVIAARAGLQ